MIQCITGLVGGCKTLSSIDFMLKHIASGGAVITNIDLVIDECRKYLRVTHGWELVHRHGPYVAGVNQITYIPREMFLDVEIPLQTHLAKGTPEKPVLVVLDEVSEILDAHENSLKGRDGIRSFMSFCRQSRKHCIDVIFITQDPSYLQKRVRQLVAFWWEMSNWGERKLPIFKCRAPWPMSLYCLRVQYDKSGKNVVGSQWWMRDRGLYKCYRTHEVYQDFGLRDGKTDFRGEGAKKMSTGWQTTIVVMLVALTYYAFRMQDFGQDIAALKSSRVVVAGPEKNHLSVDKGAWLHYMDCKGHARVDGKLESVLFDRWYSKGDLCSVGKVAALAETGVYIDRLDGTFMWILDGNCGSNPPTLGEPYR